MSHYILDTGFFIVIREYYPNTFPAFWEKMEEAVNSNLISSVTEVRREIERYKGYQPHILEWCSTNKRIFTDPTEEEQNNLREIFKIKDFQALVDKKATLKGGPLADPFLIAKAMAKPESIVVTREQHAKKDKKGNQQGPLQIPDVCQHFGVEVVSPREFLEREKWQF